MLSNCAPRISCAPLLALAVLFSLSPAASAGARPYTDDIKSAAFRGSLSGFFPTGEWSSQIKYELVKAQDLPDGKYALRAAVREGKQAWSMGMLVNTQEPVAEGDVLLASFKMRSVESMTGQALVNFVFQAGGPDWAKSAMVRVGAGSDWTQVHLPFTARGDYQAGEAMAGFHLALADQVLEVADFAVLNFGPGYDVNRLPNTDVAYDGRGPDAPWRAVAAARIDEIRKGDMVVQVVDARGRPVAGADVRVEMTRHAFPFGTAVAVSRLLQDDADGERYRQELLKNFNAGVFESAMKWNNYGTGTPEQIDEALSWLTENDVTMRGHVLMWPSWRWIDPEILPLKSDPAAFRQAIEDRVTGMTARYRDTIHDWDVVNEAYSNHDVMDMYGNEIMADWFKLAHEANPDAVLYINDNDMLTAGGRLTQHMQQYRQTIQDLLDAGAPLGGIGMQGHFAVTLTSPQQVWETLDRFRGFNLPIQVTEFDIKNDDPQLQADYLRDFLTATFAHESIAGFYIWGYWEGQHWRPEAALFNQDWSLRKHGKVWQDLIYNQWWTQAEGQTGADGTFALRGFFGDYQIVVTGPDGVEHEVAAHLGESGQNLTIKLDK